MIGRNNPCWCGSGKKWKKCHYPELSKKKPEQIKREYYKHYGIVIKTPKEIEGIRKAGHLAKQILDATCEKAKEGVTTQELNDFAHQLHLDAGAIPAPLNYGSPPFPKSICTSLNEVICHGIPNQTPLKKQDILNIDVTCILDGYYGDCSQMVIIGGETTPERQLVVDVAHECLMQAIQAVKPGAPLHAIGDAIEHYAHSKNCSVVYQFVGHGIGIDFHEAPQIFHNSNDTATPLVPGMTFTIEPMINAGVADAVICPNDQWTATTKDKKPSAQWEHTLLVTEEGCEILTPWKRK